MPVTRKQFELGIDEEAEWFMRGVAQFLQEHAEVAYSLEELWRHWLEEAPPEKDWLIFEPLDRSSLGHRQRRFARALDVLCEHRVVERRHIEGTPYFSAGPKDLNTVLES